MGVFFIGCLHFGHENMAIKRGFNNSIEHDEHLIKTFNSVVHKNDKVFLLGDITMESSKFYPYLNQLNGYKEVILGNHDKPNNLRELLQYVNKVSSVIKYKQMWLTHIPVHPIEFEYRIIANIHAHIHELVIEDKRYINVDAKQLDYKPIEYNKILERLM